ncbi:hypothetical protein BE08_10470 [Sorangium cellulosum]|uniref:Uncharacterized protein n=1 Tax=Sorangium cellulosum TaxID=56 RepID=A0A150PA60_SORCE|nr:hypothetical protein BE08_10470 [Sorangium cellulosum]
MSSWPGTVRSGCTSTRPARSSGAPRVRARGDAATPAPQSTVLASIRRSPIETPSSSIRVTRQFVRTSTLSATSCCRAFSPSSGTYDGSTCPAPSSRMMRASHGLMCRNSRTSVCRASSDSAPASSTPVGPAPTTTNVIQASRRAGSVSRSAASKARSTRRRISSASSTVLSPGAKAAHSSCPK